MSRRAFLSGLGAVSFGCAHPRVLPALAVGSARGPVRLGWRWVPGVRLTFRTTIARDVGPVTWTRAEDWQYTAKSLDNAGIATLEGRLVGFGASVSADGHALPESSLTRARDAARRATPEVVTLAMRLTGPIVSCSARGFGPSLPHRMLAVHFPAAPIEVGDSWDEDGIARAFAPILPLDVEVRAKGTATLSSLSADRDTWLANIEDRAVLGIGDVGPGIRIVGKTVWEAELGAVRSRHIEASWEPDAPTRGAPVGRLRVDVARLTAG